MAARPRSSRKRNWPDNLYERGGYYSWRNPIDGVEHGIGRVALSQAVDEALEANLHVREILKKPRLIDRITGSAARDVVALIQHHDLKVERRFKEGEIAESTLKNYRSCARAMKAAWKDRQAARVTTMDAAEFLKTWADEDQMRMRQSVRSYGKDLFQYAEAEGWIPRGSNPFTITDSITPKVKRARLTLEEFRIIYDAAAKLDPWVQRSMELAMVTAQRREDLAVAEFKPGPESIVFVAERKLWVAQQKVENSSGMRLRIPFELEMKEFGWVLEDVIGRCRDSAVSRWLIHHTRPRTKSRPGDQVWIDTITKGFRRARDRTSLKWPEDKKPPTFNELRSLSARRYEAQGNVNVQALLGHTDPATTRIYTDSRGTAWADIKVA